MCIGGIIISITGATNNYATYSASITSNQKSFNLATFNPNKKYQSLESFTNDLYALENKLRVQYSEMSSDSNVSTVEELKKEISSLFPEYTFTTSKPKDVIQGKNLLYIDETNLNKMVNDPAYKSKVYALMGRELAGTNGFHVNGSAWKLTGTAFTLSEDNSKEGGIPYAGMCTGMKMSHSHTFSSTSNKVSIFSISGKIEKTRVTTKKDKIDELREKRREKHEDYIKSI